MLPQIADLHLCDLRPNVLHPFVDFCTSLLIFIAFLSFTILEPCLFN